MGKFLKVLMRRDRGAQKKYWTKFELDIPLETPQSALDKKIFNGDWTLREGWTYRRGKDFVGNKSWIFTSLDEPDLSFDEMQLRVYRRLSYDPVFEDDGVSWKYKRDPPLSSVTSKSCLERMAPLCIPPSRRLYTH
ncbi:hypothetical protein EYZ11_010620 [Aspergillus tanneri]|uniref:Uncharacterized protein n=1 Tax=Aspergillus tanneri TaxID=1220188 RepID=A0A4S3J4W1_9EURO|nr:uncharacterized protein ATNIH1004_001871 [Aspergillus tanneri]KAA8641406.1 hypothetical protein ATNIH1004_001871 [Aspergillus tanneri]THC89923.1 hypothetical protein EYZ11_010620 [Aspergillus tanneri]